MSDKMEGVGTITRPRSSLENAEMFCLLLGILLSTFSSVRHPIASFTASDFFITFSLLFRCIRCIPKYPLQSATSLWWVGIAMVLGGLLVGSVANGDPGEAFIVLVQYFFSFVLLPLAILGRPYEEAVALAKIGVLSIVINCLVGMGAYSVGHSGGDARQFALVTGNGRVAGLTDNPNGLAGIIDLWFPVIWYLGLTKAFRPLVFASFFGITFITLIFTSSNSSLVGAFICGVIYLFLLGKFRVFFIWSTIFVVILWIGLTFADQILPEAFVERVLNPIQQGDIENAGTFDDRADLMVEAWYFLPDYFAIGMGAGGYRELSAHDLPVHNLYLLLANEGGLIALMGLLLIFLAAVTSAVLAGPETPNRVAGRTTVITITLTFAALAMNFTHVYQRAYLVPWIVSIGLLSHYSRIRLPLKKVST
ncbi:O-antigen ligase family protein [Rhodobacteraceae bacterium B1Z28]|uniref:O-antigen ligase family protein n=1 Tax=Ruegeria haliotis TaxID=2747601 RepID=A0ABX2PXP5_9RHOB|nr:O-antigen ligase family protein [Ruegeria haliotis]NVO58312.1 O-antigen ligase family protein [Ruegeria haliotis]